MGMEIILAAAEECRRECFGRRGHALDMHAGGPSGCSLQKAAICFCMPTPTSEWAFARRLVQLLPHLGLHLSEIRRLSCVADFQHLARTNVPIG